MRRALVALTIALTLSLAPGCTPAAGASPAPPTTTAPDWPAIIRRQRAERAWWAEIVRRQRADAAYLRLLRYAAAIAASECHGYGCVQGIRVCGGDLPTCPIVWRESRFDPHAENPVMCHLTNPAR